VYQSNEIVTLVLAVAVLAFAWSQRSVLTDARHSRLLAASFLCWFACWTFTIVEGFVAPTLFNDLEHVAEAAAVVLFALWTHRVASPERTAP